MAAVRGVGARKTNPDGPAVFEVKSPSPSELTFAGSVAPAEGLRVIQTGTASFRGKIVPVFRYRRTVRGWSGGLYEIELTAER